MSGWSRRRPKRGIIAGLHNGKRPVCAARMIGMGFRLVTVGNDSGLMATAAKNAVATIRKEAKV